MMKHRRRAVRADLVVLLTAVGIALPASAMGAADRSDNLGAPSAVQASDAYAAAGASFIEAARGNPDLKILAALRGGGHVLYYRHERTELDRLFDAASFRLEDCSSQRGLSVAGYAGARETGEALRRLRVPIGEIYSSPMCRTLETARIAFGRARPQSALMNTFADSSRGSAETGRDLLELLHKIPDKGTNTVVVAHFENLFNALGTRLNEGDIAVIGFTPGGQPAVIRTFVASRWAFALRDIAILEGAGPDAATKK